jgi:hypothetical protein
MIDFLILAFFTLLPLIIIGVAGYGIYRWYRSKMTVTEQLLQTGDTGKEIKFQEYRILFFQDMRNVPPIVVFQIYKKYWIPGVIPSSSSPDRQGDGWTVAAAPGNTRLHTHSVRIHQV